MSVIASITTSVDVYVAGPGDGPGVGLGRGGERLHYWVMGGPWTYDHEPEDFAMSGADKEFLDELTGNLGAGVCGRGMYDASEAWGGTNPVRRAAVRGHPPHRGRAGPVDRVPLHRRPRGGDATRDGGGGGPRRVDLRRRRRDRQALAAGYVDELAISTAPLVLGGGKRLFDGFEHDVELEMQRVYTSPYAAHVRYTVKR
jgi:hypothetical protein